VISKTHNRLAILVIVFLPKIIPIVHKPTYNSLRQPEILSLAMICLGACYTGYRSARAFSEALSELIRRKLWFMVRTCLLLLSVDRITEQIKIVRASAIPAVPEWAFMSLLSCFKTFMLTFRATSGSTNCRKSPERPYSPMHSVWVSSRSRRLPSQPTIR
jgi:Fungal specific transcription factor domain